MPLRRLDALECDVAQLVIFQIRRLRRPLKEAELNLDAYAVARVEVDSKQAP
jgi:hypothetical protein